MHQYERLAKRIEQLEKEIDDLHEEIAELKKIQKNKVTRDPLRPPYTVTSTLGRCQ